MIAETSSRVALKSSTGQTYYLIMINIQCYIQEGIYERLGCHHT